MSDDIWLDAASQELQPADVDKVFMLDRLGLHAYSQQLGVKGTILHCTLR